MKKNFAALALVAAGAFAVMPVTSAHAEGWHHDHGGWGGGYHGGYREHWHGGGVGFAAGALFGAVATIATAPFHVVEAIAAPPPPVYAEPRPVYYNNGYYAPAYPQPVYVQPVYQQPVYRQRVVYSYPPNYDCP